MAMTKDGQIDPRRTPDYERKLPSPASKQAGARDATQALDNDLTKRLAHGTQQQLD